jgi:hypothetical protein
MVCAWLPEKPVCRFVPAGLPQLTEVVGANRQNRELTPQFAYGPGDLKRHEAVEVDPVSLCLADGERVRGQLLFPANGLAEFGGIRSQQHQSAVTDACRAVLAPCHCQWSARNPTRNAERRPFWEPPSSPRLVRLTKSLVAGAEPKDRLRGASILKTGLWSNFSYCQTYSGPCFWQWCDCLVA